MVGQKHRWMFTKTNCSKNLQIKNQTHPVNTGHYMAFKTELFICNQFGCKFWLLSIQTQKVTPDIVSELLLATIWNRCAVWLESQDLSRRPFLGQVVNLDLLLCTGFDSEHAVLFLCHIFTQRPMTDRKIERSDGRCFGRQQLLANSIEIFISHDNNLNKWLVAARNFQSPPAETAADSETPCVCARRSDTRKQSRRAAPRAWPLILPSKPSITFWNSLRRDCQMTGRGSNLDSNLNSAAWPTSCKGFIASKITA